MLPFVETGLGRRRLIASSLAVPLATAMAGQSRAQTPVRPATPPAPQASPKAPESPGLHAHARRKGLFFGSAVSNITLTEDSAAMDQVRNECGILVSENAFKWSDLHPKDKSYDFTAADALMDFASHHGMAMRGHTLVWHESNPDWLTATLNRANAERILRDHIHTVAGRYAGRLVHWDVVNEPLQEDDHQPRALRDTLWLRTLGPAYLDIAFHAAAAADPKALLVLNENNTEYGLNWQLRKRGALLDLLADLVHRKVPVHAVGIQAHLDAAELAIDPTGLHRFIASIASLGLKVIITELDVRDQRLPANIPARDATVASHARAWLDAVLPHPAVLGLLTWGLSDRTTWLNDKFPRADGLPQRPLPLDLDLHRKKLWTAIAGALDATPNHPA